MKELLEELGIDYLESGHHHCRSGWIQLRECVFCNSQNYHLGYNLQARFFACWRCGGHNAVSVLQKIGATGEQIKAFLDDRSLTELAFAEVKRKGLKEPGSRQPLGPMHRRYIKHRGLDPDEMERVWQVQGIGLHAYLSWRIYIPIIYRSQIVSWTTRAIGDKVQQRYMSASPEEEAINHKHLVYGLDYCRHSIVIVEGPVDAWKIGPGAGALFGTAFTSAQIGKLCEVPYRFVCFDSSPAAQKQARELSNLLCCFDGTTQNIVIDAKDPGAASDREIRLIRKAAKLS